MAILKDGKVVYMLERGMIEGRGPQQIAAELTRAFEQHGGKEGPSVSPEEFAKISNAVACGSTIPRNR